MKRHNHRDPVLAARQLQLREEDGVEVYIPTSKRERGPLFSTVGCVVTRIRISRAHRAALIELPHPSYATDMEGATGLIEYLAPDVERITVQARTVYGYLKQNGVWHYAQERRS